MAQWAFTGVLFLGADVPLAIWRFRIDCWTRVFQTTSSIVAVGTKAMSQRQQQRGTHGTWHNRWAYHAVEIVSCIILKFHELMMSHNYVLETQFQKIHIITKVLIKGLNACICAEDPVGIAHAPRCKSITICAIEDAKATRNYIFFHFEMLHVARPGASCHQATNFLLRCVHG